MASITKETRNGKVSYRVEFTNADNRRRKIRLGGMSRKDAEYIASRVQELVGCQASGRPFDTALALWLAGIGDDLRDKLAEQGLCERRASATLGAFLEAYLASRTDAAPNTHKNWKSTQGSLVDFFGHGRDLRSIGPGDCDDWRQSLVNDGKADATISRAVKNARQFLKAAVRKRLANANPFAELKAGGERNDSRKAFVSRETIGKALDAADTEWQAIIGLCRFGGLRCPSEVLALEWDHIDWAGGRFTVTSPKTRKQGKPYRVVPLFPELRPYLEAAHTLAPDGARFVIGRYRNATSANLRTQFKRILRRAAVEPWERLFQNLRASRETELVNDFPLHVVTEWLGNTPTVATQHYLQVTPEHFERALMGATGGAEVGRQVGLKASEAIDNEPQETQETPRKTPVCAVFPEVSECEGYALQESNL